MHWIFKRKKFVYTIETTESNSIKKESFKRKKFVYTIETTESNSIKKETKVSKK